MDLLPVRLEGDTRLKAIHVFSLVEIVDKDFFQMTLELSLFIVD